MSSPSQTREELLESIRWLGRELSARTVMFHTAVAERLGLSATDHKALDLLNLSGPMTAGELAELTGLTTGAITGVVDRLEQAGYVRRTRDPHDRRKVVIEPLDHPALKVRLESVFASFSRRCSEIVADYDDAALATVAEYVSAMIKVLHEETIRLRQEAAAAKLRGELGRRE
ncbi:MAG: MarR family transcriptional regulator [Chloroflexota bacterium]|nr:MAG: MarR family transcriptional regulator [Chloroflexota bacterium]